MKDYYQLKQTLLVGTLIITAGCFALSWFFYSLNLALNYLLGACFSLVYLNMLTREVEKIGISKSRIGSTRLGLFVGLIIVATQLQQLKIIPIFLGFLTYKATVIFYILPYSLLRSVK
jgi:ATP synthase protein I